MGRTRRLVASVALIVALGAGTTAARAELEPFDDYAIGDAGLSLLHGRWGAFTALYGAGAGQFGVLSEGAYPKVVGLRYTERKGHVTGLFFALLNSIAGSMAANSPKSVTSYRSGNYIITETVYRSEAERQAMLRATEEASAAMLAAEDQAFELDLYMRSLPGGGELSGHKLNMYFGAQIGDYLMLDIGLGFGSADARYEKDGRKYAVHWGYLGMPFKLNIAAGPVLLWLKWDWNWLSGSKPTIDEAGRYKRSQTRADVELGVTTALFGHVVLQGALTTPTITSGEFGFNASVGFRF